MRTIISSATALTRPDWPVMFAKLIETRAAAGHANSIYIAANASPAKRLLGGSPASLQNLVITRF